MPHVSLAPSTTVPRMWVGFDDRPAVLHSGERRALLESTAAELSWGADTFNAVELQATVDRGRLRPDVQAQEADPLWPLASAFEDRLRRCGALDFVAMVALPLRLFRAHPEALRLLPTSYRCVLADEAQDLTETQWASFELLAAEHRHLMVVGEPAQCPSYRRVHLADEEPPFTFTWLVEQMHA